MRHLPAGVTSDFFQALVEFSPVAITLIDEHGIVRFSSPAIEKILGYTPAERLNKVAFDLVHDRDQPKIRLLLARLLGNPGMPLTEALLVHHKDGSWRHVEALAVNHLAEPAVGAMVISYRDVTEQRRVEEALRRSEARYRSLIQGAAHGLFRTTLDGRILDANPAFATMLGYDSTDELRNVNISSVYARPNERRMVIERHLRARGRTLSGELSWRKKDGTPMVVRLTARLVELEDERDGPTLQGIAEDITHKRALEEQLRQSQKMEAVGRLARGIAHDFNNVLAAILGCADLMQLRLKEGDELMVEAREIANAAERGASLTRQLLLFSRRQSVEPQVVDVHEVLRGFDTMLQRIAGEITLRLHTSGPSPKVRLEPGQLEQVVMNLVLNARDASTLDGAIDVKSDTATFEAANAPGLPPGRYARIAVRDHGAGIDPELQRLVFEPFFTTKDPARGNGLGLSIVYGIAREAGGTVTFTSLPGKGTTFEVFLPLVDG
jgi:PAS domain S-box-containing protein